ncbi:hypothetical protein BJV78DRAFT_1081303, partial [Lactifluus subvellereus]
LNERQRRAYEIVCNHLSDTLAGRSSPPLRMILYGEGGTGKSRVIQTISELGADHLLIKAACTGVAAALIGGKTTHTVASLSKRSRARISDDMKAKLESFWKAKAYLIIDEFSMIS